MSKQLTFPIILDEVPHLSINSLSKRGFFNESKTGTVSWYIDNKVASTISVSSELTANPQITLSYCYNKDSRQYRIQLEAKRSNLGKGIHWYFICPLTKKRCRKLYLVKGLFLHREAFKNVACYKSQTESKSWRELRAKMERYYAREDVYKELERKYIKKFYNGEPTRTYLRLMRKIHG
jgi:hypothetical protein